MHRIDSDGAAPGGLYTNGDVGTSTPATTLDDAAMNAVQEELCNVVTDDGGPALAKGTNNQVITRLKALFGRLAIANTWSQRQRLEGGLWLGASPASRGLDGSGNGTLGDISLGTGSASAALSAPIVTGTTKVKTSAYEYLNPVARPAYTDACEFGQDTNGRMSLNATGNYVITSGTSAVFSARVRMPPGSVVTQVALLCANFNGAGSQTISSITASAVADDVAAFTGPARYALHSGASQSITVAGGMGAALWRSITLAASPAAPLTGWVVVNFTLPATTDFAVYAVRVLYTHTVMAPS